MRLRFLQRVVTGLSLLLIVLSACNPIQSKTSSLTSQDQTIVDLVEEKRITASITGVSMDAIALHVTSIASEPLEILIPAGTYFLAENPSVQNMVARHPANATLEPGETMDIKVEAACASLHLAAPGPADTFAMVRASELPEMGKVIDQLNTTPVDYPVEQAAVWIVSDDASYDELGMLVGGSPFGKALILEEDAVRAMMLTDEAGVDIQKYSIWRDRFVLLPKITAPDLVTWLDEQIAAAASEPAGGNEATAQPGSADAGEEISQFAYQAFGSSELSATDWSAMQATGAPDTTDCGDLPTAWSSDHSMPGASLKLFYHQPVIPTRIVIYETYNPGAIFMVEVLGFSGAPAVYQGEPKVITQCPRQMIIDITDVKEPTAGITLTLDQENEAWDQIDAVELIGVLP